MSEWYNKKEEIILTEKYWTLLASALGGRRKAYSYLEPIKFQKCTCVYVYFSSLWKLMTQSHS